MLASGRLGRILEEMLKVVEEIADRGQGGSQGAAIRHLQ